MVGKIGKDTIGRVCGEERKNGGRDEEMARRRFVKVVSW